MFLPCRYCDYSTESFSEIVSHMCDDHGSEYGAAKASAVWCWHPSEKGYKSFTCPYCKAEFAVAFDGMEDEYSHLGGCLEYLAAAARAVA